MGGFPPTSQLLPGKWQHVFQGGHLLTSTDWVPVSCPYVLTAVLSLCFLRLPLGFLSLNLQEIRVFSRSFRVKGKLGPPKKPTGNSIGSELNPLLWRIVGNQVGESRFIGRPQAYQFVTCCLVPFCSFSLCPFNQNQLHTGSPLWYHKTDAAQDLGCRAPCSCASGARASERCSACKSKAKLPSGTLLQRRRRKAAEPSPPASKLPAGVLGDPEAHKNKERLRELALRCAGVKPRQ